jgi:hypothetical protein
VGRKITSLLQLGRTTVDRAAGQVRVVGVQIRRPLHRPSNDVGPEAGRTLLEHPVDSCRQLVGALVVDDVTGKMFVGPGTFGAGRRTLGSAAVICPKRMNGSSGTAAVFRSASHRRSP